MKPPIIVVDSGPLISLSLIGRLELLTALGLTVVIVDQVWFETTQKKPNAPGVPEIDSFIRSNQRLVKIAQTTIGAEAASARGKGYSGRQKGAGEKAIFEFTRSTARKIVLLFEDGDVLTSKKLMPPDLILFSTRNFLEFLESEGFISDFEILWQLIKSNGRFPSELSYRSHEGLDFSSGRVRDGAIQKESMAEASILREARKSRQVEDRALKSQQWEEKYLRASAGKQLIPK